MDIIGFEKVVKTGNKARLFLKKQCWGNGHVFCTRCKRYKLYRIINKRYRCKRCGYTFHDFTGRWINELKILYREWLWIIKLFELEVSARRISQQINLSYPTLLKAPHLIRTAITQDMEDPFLKGEIEIDETHFGGKRKGKGGRGGHNKIPVFGILERKGTVKVDILRDVTAESILKKIRVP
ncbi:MAG: IS1595 family transposase [Candidatus Bathyarchaeia archaeon]